MKTTDAKSPIESIPVEFDFTLQLGTGETLTGSPVVTITVASGTDANPGAMITTPAQISGTTVLQEVTGGVNGVNYYLSCSCATSVTPHLYEVGARLSVIPAALQ